MALCDNWDRMRSKWWTLVAIAIAAVVLLVVFDCFGLRSWVWDWSISGGEAENKGKTLRNLALSVAAVLFGPVWIRLSEIGTNLSAWHDAIEQMGLLGAIVAGVRTNAKVSDPKHPVANPGGYFRGMTRAAKRDETNLIAGWMGREEERG